MTNSPNNTINTELFCSLFGHNFILKLDSSVKKDIQLCKTCHEEFILDDIEEISGLPKTTEYISLFRTLLQLLKIKKKHLIS